MAHQPQRQKKTQKTLSQAIHHATNTPTIFIKHDVEVPKGDDAKGFLDRFRRDSVEAHRRADHAPQPPLLMDSTLEDDDDMEDDTPQPTSTHIQSAGLRYTAILRTRLLTRALLSPYASLSTTDATL